jgi:hypothetical protein
MKRTRGSFINELSNAISIAFVSLSKVARFVAAIKRKSASVWDKSDIKTFET